ncbi:MAG: hypothetical protein AAB217_14845 [Chloroflexota bacterium]
MNEREESILNLARELRGRDKIDEANIDAEFLFRFDIALCKWVGKIRGLMHTLIGQTGDAPLSREDGLKVIIHLESNPGVLLTVTIGANAHDKITTLKGDYYLSGFTTSRSSFAFR